MEADHSEDEVQDTPVEARRREVARAASDRASAAVSAAMKRAEAEAKAKEEPFVHNPARGQLSEKDQRSIHTIAANNRVRAARTDAATREQINQYRSMSQEERDSLETAARDFFRRTHREHGDKYGTANDLHPDDAKLFGVKQTAKSAPSKAVDATPASESLPEPAPAAAPTPTASPLTGAAKARAEKRIAELQQTVDMHQSALDNGMSHGLSKADHKKRLRTAKNQLENWQAKLKGESGSAAASFPTPVAPPSPAKPSVTHPAPHLNTVQKIADATTDELGKDYLETALHNHRNDTPEGLASALGRSVEENYLAHTGKPVARSVNPAARAAVDNALTALGAAPHGPRPGEPTEYSPRYHETAPDGESWFPGDQLRVVRQPLVMNGAVVSRGKVAKGNAAPASKKSAGDFNVDSAIKIAADDITKLRKPDVFRVLDWAPAEHRDRLASHIITKRPDLKAEVDDVISELRG